MRSVLVIAALVLAAPASAQNINPAPSEPAPGYEQVIAMKVPVVANDITDRPYRVIAEIETNVRKASIFHKDPSERKIFQELWERAEKVGADAVVNAEYGTPRVAAGSWGASKARGQAIRFLTDAEITALSKQLEQR